MYKLIRDVLGSGGSAGSATHLHHGQLIVKTIGFPLGAKSTSREKFVCKGLSIFGDIYKEMVYGEYICMYMFHCIQCTVFRNHRGTIKNSRSDCIQAIGGTDRA